MVPFCEKHSSLKDSCQLWGKPYTRVQYGRMETAAGSAASVRHWESLGAGSHTYLDSIHFCAGEFLFSYIQLLESRVRFPQICRNKQNACSRQSESQPIQNQISDTQYHFQGSDSQSNQLYSSVLFWSQSLILNTVIYLQIETKGTLLVQGKKNHITPTFSLPPYEGRVDYVD